MDLINNGQILKNLGKNFLVFKKKGAPTKKYTYNNYCPEFNLLQQEKYFIDGFNYDSRLYFKDEL